MTGRSVLHRSLSRRAALSTLGAVGALPLIAVLARGNLARAPAVTGVKATCSLAPALTEGPYFVDEHLFRSDLTTGTTDVGVVQGLPLKLDINVVTTQGASCAALGNVQIDIWHADALGSYSDIGTQQGQTYLRGYQLSDTSGNVAFRSVYPGWYSGRTIHIHVKARRYDAAGNKTYEFNTQLFFDETTNNAVMATAPYNARGARDTSNARDSIYGNNTSLLCHAHGDHGWVGGTRRQHHARARSRARRFGGGTGPRSARLDRTLVRSGDERTGLWLRGLSGPERIGAGHVAGRMVHLCRNARRRRAATLVQPERIDGNESVGCCRGDLPECRRQLCGAADHGGSADRHRNAQLFELRPGGTWLQLR